MKMISFKIWLEALRIDKDRIDDFVPGMKTYYHDPTWENSGRFTDDDDKDLTPDQLPDEFKHWIADKGLFAGDMKEVIPYAIPRNVPWVLTHYPKRRILYVEKKYSQMIRLYSPWLTKFDTKNFQQLPSKEYFSTNPGMPLKQEKIRNVIKFIKKWIDIQFVDDLKVIMNELDQKGISYDKEGVQKSQVNNI